MTDTTFARRYVTQFKTDATSQIVAPGPGNTRLLVSRVRRDTPGHGLATPALPDAVFSVLVQLRRQERRELSLDGRLVHQGAFAERTVSVVNHGRRPVANLLSAFDTVIFTVPQAALDEAARDQGAPAIADLRCEHEGRLDPTIWHLAQSLLPALDDPQTIGTMVAERILLASTTYFAHAFGGMRPTEVRCPDLSPTQIARAVDLMTDQSHGDVSLAGVGREMGLSPRQFVHAFRHRTGQSPDDWMRHHRIERAKAMLRDTSLPIAAIAARCGFAHAAQFTQAFVACVGVSPAHWRMQVLN